MIASRGTAIGRVSVARLRFACTAAGLISGLALPVIGAAQGTPSDYARAEGLEHRLRGLVVNAADPPLWLPTGDRFVYRKSVQGGHAFVLVDARTLRRRPAFDHGRLAASLARAMGHPITAVTLPFAMFHFADGDSAIEFVAVERRGHPSPSGAHWRCSLVDYVCALMPPAARVPATRWSFGGGLFGALPRADRRPRVAPDGRQEALIRNYNVYVRPIGSAHGTMLSTDGSEGDPYDQRSIVWSPDSKRIAAYRVRPGFQRKVHYV